MSRNEPGGLVAAETLLRRWIGLDPGTVGHAAIHRAVRHRMAALGAADTDAYIHRAETDPKERDLLVEEVVVAESWFFRDPQVFAFVRRFIGDRVATGDRTPVRVLSVPCASGEEPYSLVMALLDHGIDPRAFMVDASDVSHAALERARAGRYTANAFRTSESGFRDRWFRDEDGHAVIDGRVRDRVRFTWGNILDDAFVVAALAGGRAPYDVVFCRNLLIYLTAEARCAVERAIDSLLKPDGLLVLGAAEPPIMKGEWIPAGAGAVFALRRPPQPAAPAPPRRAAATTPPARTTLAPIGERSPALADATPPPAGASAAAPRPGLPDVLDTANRLANEGRHREAIETCVEYQRTAGPAAEVYYLMGMVHQSITDLDAAEDCFHKTLYLDSGHADAALALALLAARRGDVRLAEIYRRAAARVVARGARR